MPEKHQAAVDGHVGDGFRRVRISAHFFKLLLDHLYKFVKSFRGVAAIGQLLLHGSRIVILLELRDAGTRNFICLEQLGDDLVLQGRLMPAVHVVLSPADIKAGPH